VAQLLDSPLADREALFAFYSRERLMSTLSRAEWVEPDLAPLCRVRGLTQSPAAPPRLRG